MVFDPATLKNAPVAVAIGDREVVRGRRAAACRRSGRDARSPACHHGVGHRHRRDRARGEPAGPDHGPRDRRTQATALAGRPAVQVDMLEAAAVVPMMPAAERSTSRATCCGCACGWTAPTCRAPTCRASARSVDGNVLELVDPRSLAAGPGRPRSRRAICGPSRSSKATPRRSAPRPSAWCRRVTGARARAERLTRDVNALLDKKPTVSLPSAREVLRTKVGDCNEHTALYVAMARAVGIPARINVGLVFVRGAFYYHAWPEVYIDEGSGRGPVAAGRSDVQPVSGRRHAPAAGARRARQAGRDPAADRPR